MKINWEVVFGAVAAIAGVALVLHPAKGGTTVQNFAAIPPQEAAGVPTNSPTGLPPIQPVQATPSNPIAQLIYNLPKRVPNYSPPIPVVSNQGQNNCSQCSGCSACGYLNQGNHSTINIPTSLGNVLSAFNPADYTVQ